MRRIFGLLLAAGVVGSQPAVAADWPAFRGPLGNGFSEEKSAPTTWSTTENVKWKAELPDEGNASPIVVGDRVFVTCAQESGTKRGLYCFNRKDGSPAWSKVVDAPKEETHKTNPYCSPTPASDGKHVVVWHGTAGLYCYDLDGKELWRRTDLGTFEHIWGYAASPVIYGDLVIQNCAPGKKAFLAAFDVATGRDRWRVDEPTEGDGVRRPGGNWMGTWSTPVITKIDGEDQVVVFQPNRVVGYRPKNGEIIWTCQAENRKGDLAYSSPMIADGICVAQGGFSGGGMAFELGGRGDLSSKKLWYKPQNPQSIGTGVIIDGHMYIPDAGPTTIRCIDVKTGDVKWTERTGSFWGSIVMAGDLAYVTSQDGTTFVFRPNPEKFDLVAKNELREHSNSTPAISDGQIFIRTFKGLWCIEEKK